MHSILPGVAWSSTDVLPRSADLTICREGVRGWGAGLDRIDWFKSDRDIVTSIVYAFPK